MLVADDVLQQETSTPPRSEIAELDNEDDNFQDEFAYSRAAAVAFDLEFRLHLGFSPNSLSCCFLMVGPGVNSLRTRSKVDMTASLSGEGTFEVISMSAPVSMMVELLKDLLDAEQ